VNGTLISAFGATEKLVIVGVIVAVVALTANVASIEFSKKLVVPA